MADPQVSAYKSYLQSYCTFLEHNTQYWSLYYTDKGDYSSWVSEWCAFAATYTGYDYLTDSGYNYPTGVPDFGGDGGASITPDLPPMTGAAPGTSATATAAANTNTITAAAGSTATGSGSAATGSAEASGAGSAAAQSSAAAESSAAKKSAAAESSAATTAAASAGTTTAVSSAAGSSAAPTTTKAGSALRLEFSKSSALGALGLALLAFVAQNAI